jgi:hypothetical protein
MMALRTPAVTVDDGSLDLGIDDGYLQQLAEDRSRKWVRSLDSRHYNYCLFECNFI